MIKILEITGTFFAGFISDIGITLFSIELTYNISSEEYIVNYIK